MNNVNNHIKSEDPQENEKWYQKTWFIIIMLIFLFPVGLFLMWKYKKFNKIARYIITGLFALAFVVVLAGGPQETEQQAEQTPDESEVVDVEAEQKEADEALKNAILQFEKEIYATEEPALLAIENYTSQANRLAEGEVSIYDVYKAASIAKEKCKQVQHAYYKIEVPKVGKEIEELLKDTKSELSTAYMVKAEAFDSAMAFLDNQKPSDLQKFEDRAVEADKFIMSAVKHLFEAKDKAGIELEEGEDN